jgi:hypothetical protein
MKRINILTLFILCYAMLISCSVKKPTNVAVAQPTKTQKTIKFSGYEWIVKQPSGKMGPHANYWSGENVWVDKKGRMHFTIQYNEQNKRWECSEVASTVKFGNGTYQWKLEGSVNALDKNIVFGLFNYSGKSGYDEMDIEFSRWGRPNVPILNYTIWPAESNKPKNVTYAKDFEMKNKYSTHRFIRTSNQLTFQSLHGFQDGNKGLFETKTWSEPTSISKLEMPVLMNLWLFDNPPSDGKEVEIIVHEFKFIAS